MTEMERSPQEPEEQTQGEPALQEEQKETYVERPKSQRVLAWILAGVVIVGVILYYGWISGILH